MYEAQRGGAERQLRASRHSSMVLGIQACPSASSRVEMERVAVRKPRQGLKRALDLLICTLALPILVPFCLILSVLVCLDSRGAPIYRHERIGRNGKPFQIYKFRTMFVNADAQLQEYLEKDPLLAVEWASNHKLKNDPRLTRMGHFLRKTSLDELPQVINIFLGNMTLVGPRPIVESEKAKYGRYFDEYCEVRPGLTGLWQTSGRNNTTYSQRVAYDHYYINHWSLLLDLWIMAKTAPVALGGRGAY